MSNKSNGQVPNGNSEPEINLGEPVFDCLCKLTGKPLGVEYSWGNGDISTVWFCSLSERTSITKSPILLNNNA